MTHRKRDEYNGYPITYYRGAVDSALHEVGRIEQAMGVTVSRLRVRFEQLELLVQDLENREGS